MERLVVHAAVQALEKSPKYPVNRARPLREGGVEPQLDVGLGGHRGDELVQSLVFWSSRRTRTAHAPSRGAYHPLERASCRVWSACQM
jgi:hypothetical protein